MAEETPSTDAAEKPVIKVAEPEKGSINFGKKSIVLPGSTSLVQVIDLLNDFGISFSGDSREAKWAKYMAEKKAIQMLRRRVRSLGKDEKVSKDHKFHKIH